MIDFSLIIFSFIQGFTEFLPISSSGHLFLAHNFFQVDAVSLEVEIVLHLSTLLAVVFYFRKKIYNLILVFFTSFVNKQKHSTEDFFLLVSLLFGTIPIVIFGLFLFELFITFRLPVFVAYALIISASILFIADYFAKRNFCLKTTNTLSGAITRGLFVGFFQAFAIMPGISRSGITITAGRLMGLSRKNSSVFSFLLSIPAILGAFLLFLFKIEDFSLTDSSILIIALLTFFIAYLTIHFFIKFVEKIGFTPFFLYQFALGVAILILL